MEVGARGLGADEVAFLCGAFGSGFGSGSDLAEETAATLRAPLRAGGATISAFSQHSFTWKVESICRRRYDHIGIHCSPRNTNSSERREHNATPWLHRQHLPPRYRAKNSSSRKQVSRPCSKTFSDLPRSSVLQRLKGRTGAPITHFFIFRYFTIKVSGYVHNTNVKISAEFHGPVLARCQIGGVCHNCSCASIVPGLENSKKSRGSVKLC